MKEYTQKELEALITVPKIISKKPKKEWQEDRGHLKNEMIVRNKDKDLLFTVFMRKNIKFIENFSIGLIFHPYDGKKEIHLLRCNGPHGDFNRTQSTHPHFHCHVHIIDAIRLNEERNPLGNAEIVSHYRTYEQAFPYFCKRIHLLNWENIIADNTLFDLMEDDDL